MSQVTIYLDSETDRRLRTAAREAGTSVSAWISEMVRARLATEWPAEVVQMLGTWSDCPSAEELRDSEPDVPREPF